MITLNKPLIKNISTTLILMGILAGLWTFANNSLQQKEEGVDVLQAVACDFQQEPCKVIRGNQQIILAIETETIASFSPLEFRIQLVGLGADEVAIDFQGVDMFMGINQLDLTRQTDGSYTGTKILSGHVDQSMMWRAKVFVRRNDTITAGWFDFEVK